LAKRKKKITVSINEEEVNKMNDIVFNIVKVIDHVVWIPNDLADDDMGWSIYYSMFSIWLIDREVKLQNVGSMLKIEEGR